MNGPPLFPFSFVFFFLIFHAMTPYLSPSLFFFFPSPGEGVFTVWIAGRRDQKTPSNWRGHCRLMKWEMEEIEAVLERIWDLHDKISDAIHAISRAHFLKSIKNLNRTSPEKKQSPDGDSGSGGGEEGRCGYVFVKGFRGDEDAALAEAKSLNAIRTALENLEDHLEFFHTIQSQQQAERDAAIARLEQSRFVLAIKLSEHQGKKHKVIEEAQAFVSAVQEAGRFIAPENLFEEPKTPPAEDADNQKGEGLHAFMQILITSLASAKTSLSLDRIGGVLGNAAIFAVSVLALLQMHQSSIKVESPTLLELERHFSKSRNEKLASNLDYSPESDGLQHFDVFSARG